MLLTREELQERLIALHQASLELVQDVSLEHLLQRIVETACEQVDARYAALGVLDEAGKLTQFITVGMSDQEMSRIAHPPVGLGLIGELMHSKETLRLPILQEHPHSVGFPEHHPKMNSLLGVPIRAGEKQFGQIYLTEKDGAPEFSADDERIIQMLAGYAAAAIQNARLYENARKLAVMEERERIGMDLHDGVIQSIYGVGLMLENISHLLIEQPQRAQLHLEQTIGDLNSVIRDIRSYILDLRPRQMGTDSLLQSIEQLALEFRAHTLNSATVDGSNANLDGLQPAQSMVLFHICQEALSNTAKHAKATHVSISIWTTPDRVLMEIRDNGRGFDMEKMNQSIGHGLANMQTRAHSVGGDADISSSIGDGTTILVWIPRKNS